MANYIRPVKTTPEHLRYIAAHFRPEEALECFASWNERPEEALARSWFNSRDVCTYILPDETPLCVVGINYKQDPEGWWNPWMLGTTNILKHRTAFLHACRRYLPEYVLMYPNLRTYIDARYELSLRWAKWLGFKIGAPVPFGKNGALFCEVRL